MKKQLLAMFLSFAMIFTLIPSPAFAESALSLTAESTEADLTTGEEITVPVRAANNPGYAAGTVDIRWDNTALNLKSVDYSELAPENSASQVSSTGKYRLSFGDFLTSENYTKTGTFFTLTFTVASTAKAGKYSIVLENANVYDCDLNAVPTVLTSASVTLRGETSTATLDLEMGSAEAVSGEDKEIRLPVTAKQNPGFAVGVADVVWKASALTLTKVEFSDIAPDNGSAKIVNSGKYRISFGSYTATKDQTAKDVLFTLIFKVNPNAAAGKYQVMLSDPDVYNADLNKVDVTVKSGNIKITDNGVTTSASTSKATETTSTSTTKSTETSSATSSTSAKSSATSSSATSTLHTSSSIKSESTTSSATSSTSAKSSSTSSSAASTSHTSSTSSETTSSTTSTSSNEKYYLGNPNGDGKIDSSDASFILGIYAKLATGGESGLSEEQFAAADVNSDKKIDSTDASAVLAYYSYLSTGGKDDLSTFLKA